MLGENDYSRTKRKLHNELTVIYRLVHTMLYSQSAWSDKIKAAKAISEHMPDIMRSLIYLENTKPEKTEEIKK